MNKIQRLKIKNYKKKLKDKYDFLNVIEISYGNENPEDIAFCKMAHNSKEGFYIRFNIFNKEEGSFISDDAILSKSKEIITQYINIFKDSEGLIFTVIYNNEEFRIKCSCSDFFNNFERIEHLRTNPIIFSDDYKSLLSLMRLEYEVEAYILQRTL